MLCTCLGHRQSQGGQTPPMELHSTKNQPPKRASLITPRGSPRPSRSLWVRRAASTLYDYQILLVNADRAYHVESYGRPLSKQLILLHEKGHYDVITSLPGFFGSSYVCAHCFKPYDHEGSHCCQTKKVQCRACLQKECADFLHAHQRGLKASRRSPYMMCFISLNLFFLTD